MLDGMLFWMDYTNTFEWSTQILLNGPHKYFACPHNIPFPQENPTILLAIAEKRILAQNTNIFIDWVAQMILVWQIKNYFCSSCLPNAMQFQRRYKSKITENTNRWIRRKNNCNPDLTRWINPNILVWVWLYCFCKYMNKQISRYSMIWIGKK